MNNELDYFSLKSTFSRERIASVKNELGKLRLKTFPCVGSLSIIEFIEKLLLKIEQYFDYLIADPDIALLNEAEREIRWQRGTQLIPYLYQILGILEVSDSSNIPAEIIQPLRRYLKLILPNSDIIMSSSHDLNYSFVNITGHLKKIFNTTVFQIPFDDLPDDFYIITIPKVEKNNPLIHCILSHEIGHALCERYKLNDNLLPKISLPEKEIRELSASIFNSKTRKEKTVSIFSPEVAIQEYITSQIIIILTNWLNELCSDSIATYLFGPSYLYSFLNLIISTKNIDGVQESHPPAKYRLEIIFNIIDEKLKIKINNSYLKGFLEHYKNRISKNTTISNPIYLLANQAIDKIKDSIISEPQRILAEKIYDCKLYEPYIAIMKNILDNRIPINNDLLNLSSPDVESLMVSIFNAGWEAYFEILLNNDEKAGKNKRIKDLNKLILKSFELNEIKQRWREAKDDFVRKQN